MEGDPSSGWDGETKIGFSIILAAVGAFVGGAFALLVLHGALAHVRPSGIALWCEIFAVGFGYPCLGAAPGLLWGYFLGQGWVCPFLGAASGLLVVSLLELLRGRAIYGEQLYACFVLLGFLAC